MNRVILVGAGCGEGLITVRGAELLRRADCVVYDALLDEALLSLVPPHCKTIPVGKRAGAHAMTQEEIDALLVRCANEYPLTVRLKGGDPFVFGRGGEELAALARAGVACGVVPGVTSAVAAAELAGIPLTHRGVARSFTVVTARTKEGIADTARYASAGDTLVFLMAKGAAEDIAEGLIAGGRPPQTPAALLSEAGTPRAQTRRCPLSELGRIAREMQAPLTAVVGEVCREGLLGEPWERALAGGARVAVVGTPDHVARVSEALFSRGLTPLPCVVGRIVPLPFDAFFERLGDHDWLAFTSANGVDVFFDRMVQKKVDVRRFSYHKFAAVGEHTARRLAMHGVQADLVPSVRTTQALAEALQNAAPRERVAMLCAAAGNVCLDEAGVRYPLYEIVYEEHMLARAAEAIRHAAYVTFGSAGGANALLSYAPLPDGVRPVCIGTETAKALTARGYAPAVAALPGAEELADAVVSLQKENVCNG